ncbi:MAG: hypothetical protein JWP89_849 [Schlesneria sp.]|nr:hypothetical protein [Schlesneria sp.]
MSDETSDENEFREIIQRLVSEVAELRAILVDSQTEYLSPQAAARCTGLSTKHIGRAIKVGELACSNVGYGKRPLPRIAISELRSWMESKLVVNCAIEKERKSLVEKHFGSARSKESKGGCRPNAQSS